MPKIEKDYMADAQSGAADTVMKFMEEIIDAITAGEQVSNDLLNDYPNGDAYHHEHHTDKWYNLTDAADLLDQLHRYEETDSGLWQGQPPRDAISVQAAYTYANAVYALWCDLIAEIEEDRESGPLHDMVEDGADRDLIEGRIKDIIGG